MASFSKYPRKQETHALLGPIEHHLTYQATLQEQQHAEPAPFPFHNQFPDAFISRGYPYDPYIEKLYTCTKPYLEAELSPDDATHEVDKNTWFTGQLGNAAVFSARLIGQNIKQLPNFNLDGDRGYGWKTWRADSPDTIEQDNPVSVNYIDP